MPRTVWLLGVISFCNDAASDMLYPLMPLYLASVLMAGPGALGFIEGVADAAASLLKLCSGLLVDRTRLVRPWIVSGYALAGFGRPLVAFTTSWVWVLCIRFVDRIGKGLRSSPRDALLAASVPPAQRGLAFGLHRAMDNGGAVVGPLVAAALLASGISLRDIFLYSLAPGVLTVLLTLLIPETPASCRPISARLSLSPAHLPPQLKRYLCAAGLFTLGNASNMFLLLRARELGLQDAEIPALWALLSLVATLFATPLAALSDRIGRIRILVIGWCLYAVFYLVLGFLHLNLLSLSIWFAGYGAFLAATEGVEKALVADLAPASLRGTAFGWFNMVTGLALLPASLIFGVVYERWSPAAAFGFGAACALGAALLLALWLGGEPEKSPPH